MSIDTIKTFALSVAVYALCILLIAGTLLVTVLVSAIATWDMSLMNLDNAWNLFLTSTILGIIVATWMLCADWDGLVEVATDK